MKTTLLVTSLLSFIIVGFYLMCVTVIPPDENAIIFKRYDGGIVKNMTFLPGRQITAPWNHLITYKITSQKGSELMSRPSKDGFQYTIEFDYNFRVDPSRLGFLHSEIGEDYHEIIIKPAIRHGVEEMLQRFTSEEISSLGNKRIEAEIFARSLRKIEENYLKLESVSIRGIVASE